LRPVWAGLVEPHSDDVLPKYIVIALVVGLAIVALLYFGAGTLAENRWGRTALMVGLLALPLLLSAGNLSYGFHQSGRTDFCLSCHEMQRYGRSLFVDNSAALSAVHYQNRLVDRDSTCYMCHADYAMFGDVRAKLNGLRHVWVHYFGKIPEKMALYQPYPSANCLHCHDDARRFLEAPPHRSVLDALYTGKVSCLACHTVAHDLKSVRADQLWQAR
jgi:cytochrome c-type protein NapC